MADPMTVERMDEIESGDAAEDQVEVPDSPPSVSPKRPMNSYFLFCQLHRNIVKLRHPSAENRTISRYLGEWWSSLDVSEKKVFTDLANRLKSEFFEINPNFKWYRCPEPTIRSVMARHHSDASLRSFDENYSNGVEVWSCINENSTNNNHLSKINLNIEQSISKPKPDFTPGKLADEAQMGGLSSLIEGSNENQISGIGNNSKFATNEEKQQNPPKVSESSKLEKLQDELLETSKAFENLDEDNAENESLVSMVSRKRLLSDVSSESEDLRLPKRSCKGKRYEEFKNKWGLVNKKRPKRETSDRPSSQPNSWRSSDYDSEGDQNEGDQSQQESESTTDNPKVEEPLKKKPKIVVEKELAAINALDYDAYLAKKRENLNRKKNSAYNSKSISKISTDERKKLREETKSKLVGSEKRKPKKDSITRLELNSTTQLNKTTQQNIQPEVIKDKSQHLNTSKPSATNQRIPSEFQALETLAEVASKIYEDRKLMSSQSSKL